MDEFESYVAASFPQLAFLLYDPEVSDVLRRSYEAKKVGTPWTQSQFEAEVQRTNWYRTQSGTARQRLAQYHADPSSYQRDFDGKYAEVQRIAGVLGVGLETDRMWHIATKALAENLDEAEIRRMMVEDGQWHLTAGTTEDEVRALYADFFLPVSDDQMRSDMVGLVDGRQTIPGLRAILAERAKMLYPHMAPTLDRGLSPRQWFEPYRQSFAQLLEVNPNTIDPMTDHRWQAVFNQADDKGNVRAMTMYEAAEYARRMPEWRNTRQARDQVAALGETMLTTFGRVA